MWPDLDKQPRASTRVRAGPLVIWEGAGGGKSRAVSHWPESRGGDPGTEGHFYIQTFEVIIKAFKLSFERILWELQKNSTERSCIFLLLFP